EMFPLAPRLAGMLLYHFGLQQLLCEACAGQSIADLLECERAFGGLQRAEPRKSLVVAAIVHAVHAAAAQLTQGRNHDREQLLTTAGRILLLLSQIGHDVTASRQDLCQHPHQHPLFEWSLRSGAASA